MNSAKLECVKFSEHVIQVSESYANVENNTRRCA